MDSISTVRWYWKDPYTMRLDQPGWKEFSLENTAKLEEAYQHFQTTGEKEGTKLRIMTEEPAQLFLVNVRNMTQRKYFDVSRNVLEAKRLKVRRVVPIPRVRLHPVAYASLFR